MNSKIEFTKNEVSVFIPTSKNVFSSFLNILFSITALIYCAYLLGIVFHNNYFTIIIAMLIGLTVSPFLVKGLFWRLMGSRVLTFDKKYLIIWEKTGALSSETVFRVSHINKISICERKTVNIFSQIKSFWTRDGGGNLSFLYEGKPIKIGYGLQISELKELFEKLKEEQILTSINF